MSYKIIRVCLTEDYLINEAHLDGQTIEQVTKDWFETHSLDSYHAARDASRIGFSRVVRSYAPADDAPGGD